MSRKQAWPFDGRAESYFPEGELRIDPSLRLHQEVADEIDPITYEVIRSNLWNINLEHGDVIKKSSGAPLVVYADDFNQSIHTELGDPVAFGPSILHFTGIADLGIKWTLEQRSASPGIREGDIFLHSDPYVGAAHQMDVSVYAPVFVEGRLFAWVLNVCHARDIGGTQPGSWVVDAQDMFWESTPIPPMRIAANDILLRDAEEMYLRKSRSPAFCALELRSQVAGVLSAKSRLKLLIDRYGADVVKGVMHRMMDNCERAVRSRLSALPDGVWHSELYIGGVPRGERGIAKLVIEMTKSGERLRFGNAGTDAQGGAVNCPAGMWRAAILVAATAMLAYDQSLCAGGLLRCLDFEPVPGLRTSCSWPAAVSSGVNPHSVTYYQASSLISKMFACDPQLSRRAMAPGGMHTLVTQSYSGTRGGRYYAGATTDVMAGALGAFSFRDGVSSGGIFYVPHSRTGDVEQWEQSYPLLCLYRREVPNGGGHGQWRGGRALVSAYIGHGVNDQKVVSNSAATSVTAGWGLAGGLPGSGGWLRAAQDSGIRAVLAAGDLPGDSAALNNAVSGLEAVEPFGARRLNEDDIFVTACASGAGFGDPLMRDPQHLVEDIASGDLNVEMAERIYGMVFSSDGKPDLMKTEAKRAEMRQARLATGRTFRPPADPAELAVGSVIRRQIMAERLELVIGKESSVICCRVCGEAIAPGNENYKLRTPYIEIGLDTIDPEQFLPPESEVDARIVLRQYHCYNCATLIDSEIVRDTDPPVHDIRIKVDAEVSRESELLEKAHA